MWSQASYLIFSCLFFIYLIEKMLFTLPTSEIWRTYVAKKLWKDMERSTGQCVFLVWARRVSQSKIFDSRVEGPMYGPLFIFPWDCHKPSIFWMTPLERWKGHSGRYVQPHTCVLVHDVLTSWKVYPRSWKWFRLWGFSEEVRLWNWILLHSC